MKQSTVNLREKLAGNNGQNKTDKNEMINSFLQSDKEEKKEFTQFEIPLNKFKLDKKILIQIGIGLGLIIIVVFAFWLFRYFSGNKEVKNAEWYAIKLVNNEIYYGQVANPTTDPVAIKNVYYNYQAKDQTDQSNNLRLVKRGKESYGPSGEMLVVRNQILFMEPLKKDSKVLQAILDYEK